MCYIEHNGHTYRIATPLRLLGSKEASGSAGKI